MRQHNQAALTDAVKAVCARHYAERFSLPPDHPHVIKNVEGNYQSFVEDVQAAVFAYLDALKHQEAFVISDDAFSEAELIALETAVREQWSDIRPYEALNR